MAITSIASFLVCVSSLTGIVYLHSFFNHEGSMQRKQLYDTDVQLEVTNRINQLTEESAPQWGSMSPAQMLAHCAEIMEVTNGEKPLSKTPLIARLFKGMIRGMVVGDKPYKKNTQTHPQYLQKDEKDLEIERERMLSVIDRFVELDEAKAAAVVSPVLGTMNREERGWAMYKHLDYHLGQFNV